jgi:hypothetical protein
MSGFKRIAWVKVFSKFMDFTLPSEKGHSFGSLLLRIPKTAVQNLQTVPLDHGFPEK